MKNKIIIQGARENNLKNISLEIPKRKITIFTGVSGSGKSSLVFDTIAAESQRLMNEMYDSFIRHRLTKYSKPDVDRIENLSASVIIDQKQIAGNARSTVGTITDIYSLLRLLFSRAGQPFAGYANAFSFNNPQGMCPHCEGLGKVNTINFDKLLDKERSLNEGAIQFPTFEPGGWRWTRYVYSGLFNPDKKLKEYTDTEWYNLLYGENIKLNNADPRFPKTGIYEGILPRFNRSFFKKDSKTKEIHTTHFNRIVIQQECPECKGTRLNSKVLESKIKGENIAGCSRMQINELAGFIQTITDEHVQPVVSAIQTNLKHMITIGLGYLTLDRETSTLSGGESQRVKLVKQLGSALTDLTYLFDEPSVGLHPTDIHKLNKLLVELRNKGNTILIIEHDPDVISIADHLIDIGPGAGNKGGQIIYEGNLTATYLSRKLTLKTNCRTASGYLSVEGANLNNLQNVTVQIPRKILTTITGVAGSGKSSLMKSLLQKYPEILFLDQKMLHGTKRSNIATYTGIMDRIRSLFANANKVKVTLFSRNSEGGCPICKGTGIVSTDLAFMDAIDIPCEACTQTGYKKEVLQYRLNGKSIAEVMSMNISQASSFFTDIEILRVLHRLEETGIQYISLGQSLNTLSGGERQRLKLATQLEGNGSIYVFDEPTAGLHSSDTEKLLALFNKLVDSGKTVIIVEHNPDIISQTDWIIDMGPGAGNEGGQILFEGKPIDMIDHPTSRTATWFKKAITKEGTHC